MPSDSEKHLINLAGEQAFQRGQQYYANGRVAQLATSGDRITATVKGTYLYQVNLRETVRGLEGACDCPASEGVDFCKHCVAVALEFAEHRQEYQQAAGGSAEDRILLLLNAQPHEALVQVILDVLPDLPALSDRLTLQADLAAGVLDAKRLKKMLTKAMPLQDVWGDQQAARYFQRVESAVAGIGDIADQIPPKVLLATVLHGISRLDNVLERVDDSGGERWYTQHCLREMHIKALVGLKWPPEKTAEHLLDLTLEDPWDQFSDVLKNYADALGAQGHEAFLALAQARLDAMPVLSFGAEREEKWPHMHLVYLLTQQAEADGDIDQLIRLRVRTCTSARDCYRIAELYLQKSDTDEALTWLNKAEDAGPRFPNHALRRAVHMAREEWPAAVNAQSKLFEGDPNLSEYTLLMELADKAGSAEPVNAWAMDYLRAQLESGLGRRETCAQTLACIAREDGDMRKAFELVVEHIYSQHLVLDAAKWFEEDHPRQACELLTRAIEGFIGQKNKSGYRMAVDLIHDSLATFERLGDGAFKRLVQDLGQRHRPKRNFIALLKEVQ